MWTDADIEAYELQLAREEHHDNRYEDGGEPLTGTFADYDGWGGPDELALNGPYADDWAKREGFRQMYEQGYAH